MMRRIAAAVLYAVVSLLGAGDGAAAGPGGAWDGADEDGVLAFVGRDGLDVDDETGEGEAGGGAARSGVLGRAARACGSPVEAAWVARQGVGGAASVAVAVQGDARVSAAAVSVAVTPAVTGGDVPGVVHRMLGRALTHCRERGYLKVTLTADGAPVVALRPAAERWGFQFSRAKWAEGGPAAEFYTDLYWIAGRGDLRVERRGAGSADA